MKKIISVLLLLVLMFCLSACKKEENTSSEIDTAAQNATTSEENSTSTPSANTTPSNTIPSNSTPSNSTPSNSTPSKTEETKKESISIIGEWFLVRNGNDGKIVFYDNMTCDYLGSKNLKYDFSNNIITIYTHSTNVLYVDKGEYIRLHTPQNDIEYVREENYDKVHKKFWNEKLTAITKERKELFLGDEFSISTGVTAKINKIHTDDGSYCYMLLEITNATNEDINLANIPVELNRDYYTGGTFYYIRRHFIGNLFGNETILSNSSLTIKKYFIGGSDLYNAIENSSYFFGEPIMPLLIGDNYFINLTHEITHEIFKN
jgi:hypothetical protein